MQRRTLLGGLAVLGLAAGLAGLAMGRAAGTAYAAAQADDVALVTEAVFHYFHGASQGDLTRMEKAWDAPHAHMKYVAKNEAGADEVQVIPIAEMFKRWAEKQAPDPEGKILALDIVDGAMAVVKFQFLTRDKRYLDYLSLYKVNGEWKIVNKIFMAHDR